MGNSSARLDNLAVQRHHQRNRVLGDRVRRVGRHAKHHYPETFCHREVDPVIASAPHRDAADAARRERLQCLRTTVVVDKGADLEPTGEDSVCACMSVGVRANTDRIATIGEAGRHWAE